MHTQRTQVQKGELKEKAESGSAPSQGAPLYSQPPPQEEGASRGPQVRTETVRPTWGPGLCRGGGHTSSTADRLGPGGQRLRPPCVWLRVQLLRAEPRTRVLNVLHGEASRPRAGEGTLTCSRLRASSCSCFSFAVLWAFSASTFRLSSCSFSFARFSKFARMLLVLLFTTEGRRDARRASERQRIPRPQPRARAACHAGPGVTHSCPPAASSARPSQASLHALVSRTL